MSVPAKVWLLRHAETSTPAVFHGAESDVGLSDLGRRQAQAGAEWFRDLAPTAVVSSGMRRAADTAAPIAVTCGVPHLVEPGLHERRVGQLCGLSFSMTEGPWAETIREWAAGNSAYTSHGAESYDDVAARVNSRQTPRPVPPMTRPPSGVRIRATASHGKRGRPRTQPQPGNMGERDEGGRE